MTGYMDNCLIVLLSLFTHLCKWHGGMVVWWYGGMEVWWYGMHAHPSVAPVGVVIGESLGGISGHCLRTVDG